MSTHYDGLPVMRITFSQPGCRSDSKRDGTPFSVWARSAGVLERGERSVKKEFRAAPRLWAESPLAVRASVAEHDQAPCTVHTHPLSSAGLPGFFCTQSLINRHKSVITCKKSPLYIFYSCLLQWQNFTQLFYCTQHFLFWSWIQMRSVSTVLITPTESKKWLGEVLWVFVFLLVRAQRLTTHRMRDQQNIMTIL